MSVSLGGVASPVDFDRYGDYAPPPGAYVQRGDIATLTYPIDGRITDDGSSPFRAEPGGTTSTTPSIARGRNGR